MKNKKILTSSEIAVFCDQTAMILKAGITPAEGMDILTLLTTIKVVPSRSEGRRAVQQGGVKLAEQPVKDIDFKVTADLFTDGKLLVQKGKKTFHNVILK